MNKYKNYIIVSLIGGLVGWIYWYGWRCEDACPIQSNPINSTIYGAMLGFLLISSLSSKKIKK